jgi:hypothetical protein
MAINPRTEVWTIDFSEDDDLSNAVDKGSLELVGIELPAALDSTTLTFTVCNTLAGTYKSLYWGDTDAQVSVTFAASAAVGLDPAKFAGWRYIKISVDGTETADRTFTPIFRDYRS